MVASGIIPKSLPVPPVPSAMVRRMGYGPVQFTVADALSMVEQGITPEDASVELLNGALTYRDRFDLRGSEIAEGVKHSFVMRRLSKLNTRIDNESRQFCTQCTLVCLQTHAPIPDAVVLRGEESDLRDRLPTADDALCVVEVADSSYERDSGEKLIEYAKAGIDQYIIINLRNRTAEVYEHPDKLAGTYPPAKIIADSATLALRVGENEFFTIVLAEILP
jgi:Uma2 family endonuclease